MRKWLVTIIGIVLMGASVYGFSKYAVRVQEEVRTTTAVKPVRMLSSGEVIDASMLRSVPVPAGAVQPGALMEPHEIVGKTVVVPIGAEEQIFPWKLADDQLTPGEGERYISFKTDDVTNVGNMLRKGDRVDVWVEFEQARMIGGEPAGSVKIIEGLRIANVKTAEGGEIADSSSFGVPFQDSGRQYDRLRGAPSGKPDINTYIMSEQIYEAYTFGALAGTIKLALPDLSLQDRSAARVTEDYKKLKMSFSAAEIQDAPGGEHH
ncbi:Flp pilus assembly protein CpaB [Paenibacillus thermotolerans]|uniref:Flp pilus assembly protein CpaB n=1 Tax=Paenibacillus thermotolerans TaxID=3027807 RepID=UPI0023678F9F|nr:MULTISPECIES: SAF domain-containing protein [unclassified Paenibacillus]